MNVKKALTRKFGPLAAWMWLLLFAGVWYYYRKLKGGSGASSVSGTGTGSVGPTAGPVQDPLTLQPGESAYNPNTGTLTTAPGGGGGIDNTALIDAMNAITDALANQHTSSDGAPGTPGAPGDPGVGAAATIAPGIAPGTKNKPPHLIGKGAIRARSGAKKPGAKKGYTARGLGHGFWEYVPKRAAKDKGQAAAKGRTSKHRGAESKSVARSETTQRHHTGGRTMGRLGKGSVKTAMQRVAPAPLATSARTSQRTRTPAVTTVIQQRREAAYPAPSRKQEAVPAARPSAPPPRTQRAPARAPAPPPRRRRK